MYVRLIVLQLLFCVLIVLANGFPLIKYQRTFANTAFLFLTLCSLFLQRAFLTISHGDSH